MGNYFGRKKDTDPTDPTQDAFYGVEVKRAKAEKIFQTVYRPHIYIDFYKSQLFKVSYLNVWKCVLWILVSINLAKQQIVYT